MERKKLVPGGIIDARCTKCRTVTNHTIIALVEERPVRVRCNTCNGEHQYRPPVQATPKAPRKPRATKAASARAPRDPHAADRRQWEELVPALDRSLAKDYAMTGAYQPRDLLDHPIFGLGLVLQVIGDSKMEVLFRDGRKLLRCR